MSAQIFLQRTDMLDALWREQPTTVAPLDEPEPDQVRFDDTTDRCGRLS